MSRKLKEDLEQIYESMHGPNMSMKVGSGTGTTAQAGDLDGPAKEVNNKTGPENSDVKTAEDAPENLQGDTVEDSKKKKGGSSSMTSEKTLSKFEELYKSVQDVIQEEDEASIENKGFDDTINDFPPAGAEEETAERGGLEDEMGGETVRELFMTISEAFAKLADKFEHEEEEILGAETEVPEGEEMTGEAVESTPAPEAVGTLTSKGNMDVGGVKVVKKTVSSSSSGEENGGKPKSQPNSSFGPKMSLKANGSGPAADGRDASAFES